MFRAAAGTGVATRPLLVFYGLSQAGRAIAAAAASAGADGWELEGHGIACVAQTLRGPLPGVRVQAGKGGAAPAVSCACRSCSARRCGPGEPLALSLLWDLLPDNRLTPLDDTGRSRRTPLYLDHEALDPDQHPLVSLPVAYRRSAWFRADHRGDRPGGSHGLGRYVRYRTQVRLRCYAWGSWGCMCRRAGRRRSARLAARISSRARCPSLPSSPVQPTERASGLYVGTETGAKPPQFTGKASTWGSVVPEPSAVVLIDCSEVRGVGRIS